ncbi:MAG TPA: hypothetical protein VHP38_06360 [Ruminiclostridium sp.]|nr:hypothetical protein [Ruminiclostridium sp.]
MKNNSQLDSFIKKEFSDRANEAVLAENGLQNILVQMKSRKKKGKNYAGVGRCAAVACIALAVTASILFFSSDARAMALDVINNIKTVFILDSNGKVIEKPANEVLINPAVSRMTQLSDEELSKKSGMKVFIPQTFFEDFRLQGKSDIVAFNKRLSYNDYDQIKNIAFKAIDDEEAFKSLKPYKPYRSIGCLYKNGSGTALNIAVMNTSLKVSKQNGSVFEVQETKVGNINAQWIGGSYTDYNGGEMTQKPVGKKSIHALFWTSDGVTYEILSNNNNSLSNEKAVKIAEAFMKTQK